MSKDWLLTIAGFLIGSAAAITTKDPSKVLFGTGIGMLGTWLCNYIFIKLEL